MRGLRAAYRGANSKGEQMKVIVMIALILASCTSWSAEAYLLEMPKNTVGKVEAARAILFKKSGAVFRCQEVELSDKLTLKVKRK